MLANSATAPRHGTQSHAEAEHRGLAPVDIVPFAAWHLAELEVQPDQWEVLPCLTQEYGRALEAAGGGFTAFEGSRVIAAAGIVTFWPGRGQVWALITPAMGARVMVIHRAVYRAIQRYEGVRLECIINPEFEASVKWARALGFRYESTMPKYGIDGRTMDMYVHERIDR